MDCIIPDERDPATPAAVMVDDDHPWKLFYDTAATVFGADPFPFLNLGFADIEFDRSDPEIAERLSERLYEKTLDDVDLKGQVVLEVGCGRGGGCAYMARTHQPKALIGVDINELLVRHCAEAHRGRGLWFTCGNATRLPISDEGIDTVVNVESSHCYSSRLRFFEEVARVLKPGGRLAFADLLLLDHQGNSPEAVEGYLADAGLEIVTREEITAGVIAARDLASVSPALRDRLASTLSNSEAAAWFERFYFMRGSPFYDSLKNGKIAYWRWTAQAPC